MESLCWKGIHSIAAYGMLGAGRWVLGDGLGARRLMSMLKDHDRLGSRMRGGHVSGNLRPVIGLATTDLSPDQP